MACLLNIIIFSLLILLNIVPIYSFSACDEIDITFLIDSDSIISDSSNSIIKFITSIIWSGSSEHSGFSVAIYGNTIPIDQHIKIISLYDTQSTIIRSKEEQLVSLKLSQTFSKIKNSNSESKSINVLPAFKIATDQSVPKHLYNRKKELGYNLKDSTIGNHDGQKIYFIFDYKNKLLKKINKDLLCNLFYHLDSN
eukprot:507024_1